MMLCDELKYERLGDAFNDYPDSTLVIRKQYVDAAIAELKAKLDSVQASAYAESVDAGMENRKLKRALWLARAERAKEKQNHFALCHNHSIDLYLSINGASMPIKKSTTMRLSSEWSMIWKKVSRKCRAKAEEYK